MERVARNRYKLTIQRVAQSHLFGITIQRVAQSHLLELLSNELHGVTFLELLYGGLHTPPTQPPGLCSHKPLNLGDTTPGGCEAEGCVEPQYA